MLSTLSRSLLCILMNDTSGSWLSSLQADHRLLLRRSGERLLLRRSRSGERERRLCLSLSLLMLRARRFLLLLRACFRRSRLSSLRLPPLSTSRSRDRRSLPRVGRPLSGLRLVSLSGRSLSERSRSRSDLLLLSLARLRLLCWASRSRCRRASRSGLLPSGEQDLLRLRLPGARSRLSSRQLLRPPL